ncbi:MAG: nicotinate-nucleotide--dimethylbenzimidazole phosphoribosyltransferase [Roseburia inulinivorans]|nr:nicotinate-nucleotide--dimethylbenzimidazole phosphoribosyltransferase [bacterium]MDY3040692.1 nicotinate-nucleotide--dimethylbenzimidazole phosphoribosyltransferase [Roseburia inulinivorans]
MEFKIDIPDKKIEQEIKANWDRVAKPLDGLGEFEGLLARIGAILGSSEIDIGKKAVIVMCADNGVVAEGVSQSGQEITAAVTENLGKRNTSVCKMAKAVGTEIFPVDVGVNTDRIFPGVISRKVKKGTSDFLLEPAMSEEEAMQAVRVGMELVKECKEAGYTLLGTGEMGIGNTTTSAAMAAALLSVSPEIVVGRGAGLSDEGLATKRRVIADALEKYQLRGTEPMRILCSVGGLDIAGLCGVFLGGAKYHMPIVADGVISAVAALTAERLCPGTKEFIIPSHKGKEPASELLMRELGLYPVIDAGLALGEGTGAVMMFSLLDIAMTLYETGATFADFEIEEYHRF